jgi:hypothetical protein
MDRLIGFIALLVTVSALVAAIASVYEAWDSIALRAAALGFLAGCIVYQVAHRVRYGHWFDPPTNPPP